MALIEIRRGPIATAVTLDREGSGPCDVGLKVLPGETQIEKVATQEGWLVISIWLGVCQ